MEPGATIDMLARLGVGVRLVVKSNRSKTVARYALLAIFAIPGILSRNGCEIWMPTRNINLTADQDAFVQEVVDAGEYQNASEAIRDALRALKQRRKEDSLRLKALRAQVKAGVDALERGDFAEVDDADLEEYLERLTPVARKRTR